MAKHNAVQITSSDKVDFERFGCVFHNGTFLINWKDKNPSLATNAAIYACLGLFKTNSGPIVFLGFEISAVRSLPSYYYYPFDMNNRAQRAYLSRLTKQGEIRFQFLTSKGVSTRKHCLTPYLRSRAAEILAETMQQWEIIGKERYDFDEAFKLMEHHLRIPALLNRLLVHETVNELSQKIAEAIKTVPQENRELANITVNKAAEAFTQYYRNNRNEVLEFIRYAPLALTCISDLHRIFADNPRALTEFLRDALGASFSKNELERLDELVTVAVAFLSFFRVEDAHAESASFGSVPVLPTGLSHQLQSMKISGISKEAAIRFLALIGLETGGRAGRPTKDYSREHNLKASGSSWPEVTREAFLERENGRPNLATVTLIRWIP